MSRLIPLAVALLLLTAGCTSAGPQSPSSNNVTTEVSTASPVDVQTEAATGTQTAESSGDASNAAAEGETEMDDADGGAADDASATTTPETDTASSESDASSGSQADDDSNANSRSNAGGSNDDDDADDDNDADDDDSSANAGGSNDSDDESNSAPSSDSSAATDETTESPTETETPSPSADDANQTEWTVEVVEVVEADTLTVEFSDGSVDEVRLVGVEAPDGDYANDDFEGMPTEDGGEEWLDDYVSVANDFTRERVAGENVTIRVDSAADRRDAQGRLLVYLDAGGETLNEQLVRQGHAQVSEHSFSKRASYEEAETNARQGYSGLWQFFEADPLATETETDTSNQNSWTVTVEDVLAGDRVEVAFADGQTEVVQLLGVDTPDGDYASGDFEGIASEDGGEEWLDDWEGEAESYTSDAVGGDEVTISVDSEAPRRDADGTLLVYLESDDRVLNERLIQQGYAQLSDRSFSERDDYADAEVNAQHGYSGLWEFLWEDPLATDAETETDSPAMSPDDEAASTEEATETTTATTQSEPVTETGDTETGDTETGDTETAEASGSDSAETTDTETTDVETTDTETEPTDTDTETADTETESTDTESATTGEDETEDTDEATPRDAGDSATDEEETADSDEGEAADTGEEESDDTDENDSDEVTDDSAESESADTDEETDDTDEGDSDEEATDD